MTTVETRRWRPQGRSTPCVDAVVCKAGSWCSDRQERSRPSASAGCATSARSVSLAAKVVDGKGLVAARADLLLGHGQPGALEVVHKKGGEVVRCRDARLRKASWRKGRNMAGKTSD